MPGPRPARGAARGGRASASRPATRRAAPTRRSGCRPPTCSARSGPTPTAAARRTDALAPATFVHDINVPVFLAGAWQDQETGSHFANMLGNFSPDIPMKITLMNGVHQDSLAPAVLSEWIEFLDFYVAKRIPSIPPAARALATIALSRSVRAGRHAGTRPLHGPARLRVGVARLRSRSRGCGCCSTSAPATSRCPRSRRRRRRSRCRAPPRRRGTSATTARSPSRHPRRAAADRFTYDPSAFPRDA